MFVAQSSAEGEQFLSIGPKPEALSEGVSLVRVPFGYWGLWGVLVGLSLYFGAILLSILRLVLFQRELFVHTIAALLWASGFPTTVGIILIAMDLALYLPVKRRCERRIQCSPMNASGITVALTAYNDELSIAAAVQDFLAHPRVKRVIVVSNNSRDRTIEFARAAGAIAKNEERQGYGHCVYRCLSEAAACEDTDLVALCEGDMTFRA